MTVVIVTTSPRFGAAPFRCRRYRATACMSSGRLKARYAVTRYVTLFFESLSSLTMSGNCMGLLFGCGLRNPQFKPRGKPTIAVATSSLAATEIAAISPSSDPPRCWQPGGFLHPPGVLSAGVARMMLQVSSLKPRKGWARRVRFFFVEWCCVSHAMTVAFFNQGSHTTALNFVVR